MQKEALSFNNLVKKNTPPQAWLPSDAKTRFDDDDISGIRGYLPGHATLIEIIASRIYYVLNGCFYAEVEENFIIMALRPIGYGCRMAFFMSSVIFCFLTLTCTTNPIKQYNFSRERNPEGVLENDGSDPFEWFVYLTYLSWVISIFSSVLTYLIGRIGSKNPYRGQFCAGFPFMFCNRTSIDDENGSNFCWMIALVVWFVGLAACASIFVFTAISHTFVKRNIYFSWVLVVLLSLMAFGTLADALSLGGPTGIYVQNRAASWLASLRIVVISPIQVILTVFFLILCAPA